MNGADVFVISDLHLGDGKSRDNFSLGNRPEQFRSFLDFVESEGKRLIILGDLFEFWQANLGQILVNHEPLLSRLARMEVEYVVGNHDVDLLPLVGRSDILGHPFFSKMKTAFTDELQLQGEARTVRFMHGHECDPFNNQLEPHWGRMLTVFAGIFEDKNKSPLLPDGETVEETLEQFGELMLRLWNWCMTKLKGIESAEEVSPKDALTPAQNPSRLREHLEQMSELRAEECVDFLVVGHTHSPGCYPDLSNPWYFNSGGWVTVRDGKPVNNFVRLSEESGIATYDWTDEGAVRTHALVTAD